MIAQKNTNTVMNNLKKRLAATGITLALTAAMFVGFSAVAPAANAACFKTVTTTGVNGYGYGRTSSLANWRQMVRSANKIVMCINYSTAKGGYYIASFTCSDVGARLTTDSTSVTGGRNSVVAHYLNSATCHAAINWKWHRTVAAEQCTTIQAQQKWWLNQANGAVTRGTSLPVDGNFLPKSGC